MSAAATHRPGREDGILIQAKWNPEGYDDVDSISASVRKKARERRSLTAKGLIDSLAHPAEYEDKYLETIVIDPGFVDLCRAGQPHEALRATVEPKLRVWLRGGDLGKKQRALYALIRWHGPTSELVASGLAGPWYEKEAVLEALRDVDSIPGSLEPAVRGLLQRAAFDAYIATEPYDRFYRLVARLVARLASPERNQLALQCLEIEELRAPIVSALNEVDPAFAKSEAFRGFDRPRILAALAMVEASRSAGLPNRAAIAKATEFMDFVEDDAEIARAVLGIFDLLPGIEALAHTVPPFAALLARCIDHLLPHELEKLAALMTANWVERYPAAAAAWVRLPPAEAEALSKKFNGGNAATLEARQQAMAIAYWKYPGRTEAIRSLITPRALTATAEFAPPEVKSELLVQAIRGARNLKEFELAVQTAASEGASGATRSLLAQLRETPMRVGPQLEDSIAALLEPDDEDWIEQDIDGENPFRDRREMLKRCLAQAKKRWVR